MQTLTHAPASAPRVVSSNVTLKSLVQEKLDAIADLERVAEAEIDHIQERTRLETEVLKSELREAFGGIDFAQSTRPTRAHGRPHSRPARPTVSLRDRVLAAMPGSRQEILQRFRQVRPGSIDNAITALIEQGKVARTGPAQYARVNGH